MNSEKKIEFIINLLPLIPLIAKGVSGAAATYDKMVKALKDGVTDDEMSAIIAERDAILDKLIADTQG